MQTITISTRVFSDELNAWVSSHMNKYESENGNFKVAYEDIDKNKLVDLLNMLIIQKNPAVGDSVHIRGHIMDSLNKYKETVAEELMNYLCECHELNLEGYIKFRLWEYSLAIDNMLYALAKKALKTAKHGEMAFLRIYS